MPNEYGTHSQNPVKGILIYYVDLNPNKVFKFGFVVSAVSESIRRQTIRALTDTNTKRKSQQSTRNHWLFTRVRTHTNECQRDFISSIRWAASNFKREWVSLANNYYSLFLDCVQPKTIINIIVIIASILFELCALSLSLAHAFFVLAFH